MTTPTESKVPGWMDAWLSSPALQQIRRDNPVLWSHILLACQRMAPLEVLLHDLYKNLAGVRPGPCCANATEPTEDVRRILGVGKQLRYRLKNACLTTPHRDAKLFLTAVVQALSLDMDVTDEMVERLVHRIEDEQHLLYVFHEVVAVLKRLKTVYRQGLITDSWPFPVHPLLAASGIIELLEQSLIVLSSEEGICKSAGDGTELYRIAANKAGFFREPFSRIGVIGDNLFREVFPALKLGMVVILMDRDYEYMDRSGNWRSLVRSDSLLEPIMTSGRVWSNLSIWPAEIDLHRDAKLRDLLDLEQAWHVLSGSQSKPWALPEHEALPLAEQQVQLRGLDGSVTVCKLGDVTTAQAVGTGLSFADLLVPVTDSQGLDVIVPLRDVPLRFLLDCCSDLVVPCGEYLPDRLIRCNIDDKQMATRSVGDLTLEQARAVTFGNLLVDYLDDNGNADKARLADLPVPVLRSYKHVPAPLARE